MSKLKIYYEPYAITSDGNEHRAHDLHTTVFKDLVSEFLKEYELGKEIDECKITDIDKVSEKIASNWQFPVQSWDTAIEEGYDEEDIEEHGYDIQAVENEEGYLIYEKGWLE